MGMNDLLFARELQLLRFLLGKAIYQWNGGCTLSTFPLFFWISRYLGKKWCLITELCIPFSCKMALRWASCCWGVQTLPLRCTSCQDLCWQNTTKSVSQCFKGVAVIPVLHGTSGMVALSPAVKMPSQMEELQLCQESNSFSGALSCWSILRSSHTV